MKVTASRLPQNFRRGGGSGRLNIVAHDRFQEIVEEANDPNSTIRLQQVVLNPDQLQQKTVTVVSQSQLASKLGLKPDHPTSSAQISRFNEAPAVFNAQEQKVAQIAYDVIRKFESQPEKLPSVTYLRQPDVQAAILKEVANQYRPAQMELTGITQQPDLAAVVAKTTEIVVQQIIDIPPYPCGSERRSKIRFQAVHPGPVNGELPGARRRAMDQAFAH